MRCAISFDRPLNPYAMAVHQAAHAVASCVFDIPVIEISASFGGRQGTFEAEDLSRIAPAPAVDHRARHAAEKEGIALLAGAAAQVRGTGLAPFGYECEDNDRVFALLGDVEPEEAVQSAWFEYLRERTRVLVENEIAWRLIADIAGALLLRGVLSGATVRGILTDYLDRRDAMPPSNVVELPVLGRWPTL